MVKQALGSHDIVPGVGRKLIAPATAHTRLARNVINHFYIIKQSIEFTIDEIDFCKLKVGIGAGQSKISTLRVQSVE